MACAGTSSGSTECLEKCSWLPCLASLLRAHIGDLDEPPTYTDDRLGDILIAAAFEVSNSVTCIDVPTINFCGGSFSSNPFLYPSFVNLWVLKAACMVDRSAIRTRALQDGIRAVAGPASLEVKSGGILTYKVLFENGACAAYQDMLENLCFRAPMESAANCVQIVGTFVSEFYSSHCGYTPDCNCR